MKSESQQETKTPFLIRIIAVLIIGVLIPSLAVAMAEALLRKGIYVIAFSFPVVPRGAARIRVQLSASHSQEMIDRCVAAFAEAGRELGALG